MITVTENPDRDETYRAALPVHDVDGHRSTLLVLRRGLGPRARVWLCLHSGIAETAVLDRAMVAQLRALLDEAAGSDR